ncbi:hypothetical protein NUW54_g4964 [Trametes sanguinea]|uniref:Uncharacterized protein n=1 Tax=Trametes sanguinea TaxID=158606 RepID=A0ACC1PWE4_9APHY|nr:hypothetical protein NUW54_g4964 [Trametes sanguinea]
MSTNLAVWAHKNQPAKTLDDVLPDYLQDYCQIFEKKTAERMPILRPWDHAIDLKPGFVCRDCKIIPLSPQEHSELDKFIDDNLAKGYIHPSKSPMASPIFFVKKKNGTLRPVLDYRYLNEGTIKNAYPLPLISDLFDKLKGARYFTKLDVRAGYNNVRIKEGDQWKAAFKTAGGLFGPTVMFFGLCNTPATFQAMMNNIFRDFLAEGWMIIYMDDILLFLDNLNDLRKHTKQFDKQEVEFLDAIVRPGEIAMDPVKLEGLKEWQTPTTVKQVQSFLGFANFYCQFIQGYADIAKPLNNLTRKDIPCEWTKECDDAFTTHKQRFMEAPILVTPDPTKPFQVECGASKVATGAVLRQKGENDHDPGTHDNKDITLLPNDLFAKAVHVELQEQIRDTTSHDKVVMESLNGAWHLRKEPIIGKKEDWKMDNDIVLFKDKVYVPPEENYNEKYTITIDYVTGLPTSNGFDVIQVVVDHDVTKAIVLSPCTKETSAMDTAHILAQDVYSHFGLPDHVISDRGPQFISKAFQELNKLLGIQQSLSTAHHPQTDRQSERAIQELEVALRIYCGNYPDTWSTLLPQFEFAHNQRTHSVTGKSPFELLMGYQPRAIGMVMGPTTVKLRLPSTWRIHPIFHTSLISHYHTTPEHGPNYVTPPPDIINGNEEWEIESIINHRKLARGGIQYLVTWKERPSHENEWLQEKDLKHAQTILQTYKRQHKMA